MKKVQKFNKTEVNVGTKIELEHVKTLGIKGKQKQMKIAKEIAKDHLREVPNYYQKLLKYVEPNNPLGKKFKKK